MYGLCGFPKNIRVLQMCESRAERLISQIVVSTSTIRARTLNMYVGLCSSTTVQGLCSSRVRWPLVPKLKMGDLNIILFHENHMLSTIDFTDSEHWAPFNFPLSTALYPVVSFDNKLYSTLSFFTPMYMQVPAT